jgi:hypothetical protein
MKIFVSLKFREILSKYTKFRVFAEMEISVIVSTLSASLFTQYLT